MQISNTTQKKKVLFLGDCNTLGTPEIEGDAYPEQLAQHLNIDVINCGHTMSTTREGCEYFKKKFTKDIDLLCIQYGLVDSWLTFKYAPYVLYYPDSKLRKFGRKLTKKFKKLCKKFGLNESIGTQNVVPLEEYLNHILWIHEHSSNTPIILIDTVPNKDISRNSEIKRYNQALSDFTVQHCNIFKLNIYTNFEGNQKQHYIDPTHISPAGHKFVANKLFALIQSDILLDEK
jgi:lysophospholipase L1-like esterase